MTISAEAFFQAAAERVAKLQATQMDQIRSAAALMADRIAANGVVHIFGTGHSAAFGMELANRAGGLVPMDVITLNDLCSRGGEPWSTISDPSVERDPQLAHRLLALHVLEPRDMFIIVSNSGRNGSTVEMAMEVKRRSMPLVVVTSMEHTQAVTSRHPSGKRLFELGDVVIDNCGPFGDALLRDDHLKAPACSISSITGAYIAQALTAEVIRLLLEKGQSPPILISANVDGADEHNQQLRDRYGKRISR